VNQFFVCAVAIVIIAIIMTMTGRGGGNFYIPILVAGGIAMYQAATTGRLILVAAALSALVVFHNHQTVDWKLVLVIDPPTDIMAFMGVPMSISSAKCI